MAQSATAPTSESLVAELTSPLPDSPGTVYSSSLSGDSHTSGAQPKSNAGQSSTLPPALPRVKFISAGRTAPPQRAKDKVILGLRETLTPYSIGGWFLSAGWAHLIDGVPNYGVNSEAFAQRLGAAAVLGSSKEIFSDSIMAPILHQDPRYYQLGRSHKFFNRALYAGTRPIIGRTDSGKTIPNYAYMIGTAAAAGLTQAYYPDRNVGAGQVARAWATSLGGSALGDLATEFGGEIIQWLHLPKYE
ncbi:MAG TPA: hypothetical protein VL495_04795 [Edaphobacter sp.]|nr:hypothetical protein [Edaphobacter sp.]